MENKRCYVVDENGNVLISGGEVIRLLSKSWKCDAYTHVLISYFLTPEEMITKTNEALIVYPIEDVYFF